MAKPTNEISVLAVVEAIDGPIFLNECTKIPNSCPFLDSCPLLEVWREARTDLVEKLSSTTFTRHNITPAQIK